MIRETVQHPQTEKSMTELKEAYESIVEEFFTHLAESGELTEDASDDDIMDVIIEMNMLAHALNETFDTHYIAEELKNS